LSTNKLEIPVDTPALQILRALNQWAEESDYREVRRLWFVLTALRGPDDERDQKFVKWGSTAALRQLALSVMAEKSGSDVSYDISDRPILEQLSLIRSGANSAMNWHFRGHIRQAADAFHAMLFNAEEVDLPPQNDPGE
jgi:hypothetical protein